MAELSIDHAKETARTALRFLASFDDDDFTMEDTPKPNDRRHLAIALDHLQELASMVLNLADRVQTEKVL
jgi:hypothetical protein